MSNWNSNSPDFLVSLAEESNRCWIPIGREVTVGGIAIPGGVYVGSELHRQDGLGGENCLIDPSLSISPIQADFSGAHMPYWPSYGLINPACRTAYLRWLAGDRSDPAAYIGYVFLYFYGLERRLMLDDAGEETAAIIAEVQRLHSIYHDNHSFNRYASALLGAAAAKSSIAPAWPPLSLQKVAWQLPLDLLVAIGNQVSRGLPLDAFQMLAWYNSHSEKRLPSLASKCPEEFKALFKSRFDAKFPNGITVTPPKRILGGDYRAASGTFTVHFQLGSSSIPDVSGLTAPLNSIDAIVEACAADLSTYARLLGKDRTSRNAMAAATALPEALLSAQAGSPLMRLKEWLSERSTEEFFFVDLSELLNHIGAELPSDGRTVKTDLVLAADALARCGFGMEPDPKIAYPSNPNANDVVVFKAPSDIRSEPAKPEFLGAVANLDIGMMVASADNVVAPAEIALLKRKIDRNPDLSDGEKSRLSARRIFLSKYPPTTRLFTKFKDRSLSDRETIARLALSVAAADGVIAVEEVRTLEKLYKTLDLEAARLYSDLQALNPSDDQPPVVAVGEPSKSVPIPARPKAAARSSSLDMSRLAKTRADTAVVSSILGEIFTDCSDSPQSSTSTSLSTRAASVTTNDVVRFPGLDPRYAALLAAIAPNKSMTRGDFEALTSSRNLMCDGAIEAINDWFYEHFDGPVLDDGPNILINNDILSLAEGHAV
jgi:hypothetical protein